MLDVASALKTGRHPSPEGGPLFVISGRCGRLANRIVLFASFIALVAERGGRVANPTFHSYAPHFETTRREIYCRFPMRARRSVFDAVPGAAALIRGTRIFFHAARAASVFNERFPACGARVVTLREISRQSITDLAGPDVQARIAGAEVVLVNGWTFRSGGLTLRHGDAIRRYFRPIPTLEEASRKSARQLRDEADLVVGVHVRRGDYATWRNGKFFFAVSRYADWMRQLAEQFPGRRLGFVVCSDEPLTRGDFAGLKVAFGQGHPVADLYGLAECDYVFGPPSTYSQWASFYGSRPLLHLYAADQPILREQFAVSDLAEIPGWRPA